MCMSVCVETKDIGTHWGCSSAEHFGVAAAPVSTSVISRNRVPVDAVAGLLCRRFPPNSLTAISPCWIALSMLPWPRRWPTACSGLPAAAASFSIEFRLPVGVARCLSSRAMRPGAPCIGAGIALFPSRLDRARSWFFLDLKRNAMVNQESRTPAEDGRLCAQERRSEPK